MIDIRTKREIKRDELHKKVCDMYQQLRRENPDASVHRLCLAIGRELDLTAWGVRRILVVNGLYKASHTKSNHLVTNA